MAKIEKFEYDKVDWQWKSACEYYCEDYEKDVDDLDEEDEQIVWEWAGNHIAFFLTWLIDNDLLSDMHDDLEDEKNAVKSRTMSGIEYLSTYCDMVLSREDMADKVLRFVDSYYEKQYMKDYCKYMEEVAEKEVLKTRFSWEDYEGLKTILDEKWKSLINTDVYFGKPQ